MKLDHAVGQRIARAREFLGLTQATVAERMKVARTTQVAIEQGQRPVSVTELFQYSEILGRPLDYFLGAGVWHDDTGFHAFFRQMSEKLRSAHSGPPRRPGRPRGATEPPAERQALTRFETLCRNLLDLERLNALPAGPWPELPTPKRLTNHEAEWLAATVRAHLDAGNDSPLCGLRGRLEETFGLRVFVLRDAGQLTCATFPHSRLGGCVLLADDAVPRMRFRLAQALGHLLGRREEALVHASGKTRRTPLETFAWAFALALLLPGRGLRERFAAVHAEATEVNEVTLAHLARTFGVGLRTLGNRLQSLRLLPGATLATLWRKLETINEMPPGPAPTSSRWPSLPERYSFLALRAARNGLISKQRLAECLETTEAEVATRQRAYVDDLDTYGSEDPALAVET